MAMSAPDLDDTDEASVRAALRSGVLAMAPCAEEFDELAAGVAGTTHAVAVSSARLTPRQHSRPMTGTLPHRPLVQGVTPQRSEGIPPGSRMLAA